MTQNIKYMLLATLLLTASMISCNPDELPAMPLPDGLELVEGDTIKTKINEKYKEEQSRHSLSRITRAVDEKIVLYKSPKLPNKPSKKTDLEYLKKVKNTGKDLNLIAIGGGITAGFRDFGYFNEGMITSYPNMVARQMGIKKFELPLFDAAEYNGIGRQVPTDFNPSGGPLKKFASVKNNTAYDGFEGATKKLKDYKGDPDNLAYPFQSRIELRYGSSILNSYPKRVAGEDLNIRIKIKKKEDLDFFIIESGFDDLFKSMTTQGDGESVLSTYNEYISGEKVPEGMGSENYVNPEVLILRDLLLPMGAKGVILNVPDVTKLPFLLDGALIYQNPEYTFPSSGIKYSTDFELLFPTNQIDSILSRKVSYALKPGVNPNYPLMRAAVSRIGTLNRLDEALKNINEGIRLVSLKYNVPVVDIASLYEKVSSKEGFMTEQGMVISTKEFFSEDEIYPSPLGQAMIANEVIKTINANYKTDIPMIDLREMME